MKCDGADYPNGVNHWTSCHAINSNQWQVNGRAPGQADTIALWTLASDEKSLVIQTVTPSYNRVKSIEKRFDRVSGASGFGGKWVDANPLAGAVHNLRLSVDAQTMHIAYPELQEYADIPLFGAAKLIGTVANSTTVISIEPDNPLDVAVAVRERGALVRNGTMKIVDNGKVLIKQSWLPQAPNDKETLFYNRQ